MESTRVNIFVFSIINDDFQVTLSIIYLLRIIELTPIIILKKHINTRGLLVNFY